MATTDALVNVKVVGLQSLTKLDNAFVRLQKKIGGVQGAVAGLGLAALTRNAFQAADVMVDLSNATGVAISQILELQYAMEEAGGRMDQVNSSVIKFSLSIDEAAQGSIKLQDTFAELGVSLDELATLSQEQLLQEVAKGFLQVKDKARAATLANDLFGKSIRGVDIATYSREILENKGRYDEYAITVEKAAKLQGKLDKALIDVRIAFIAVIEPFIDLIDSMRDSEGGIERFTELIRLLVIALSALAGGALLRSVAAIVGSIGRGFATMVPALKKTFAAQGPFMTWLRGFGLIAGSTIAGSVAAGVTQGAGQFRGGRGATGSWGKSKAEIEAEAEAERTVYNERLKTISQIQQITQEYGRQQEEFISNIRQQRESLDLSIEETAAREAFNEVLDRANQEVQKLEQSKKTLGKEEQWQTSIYQQQIDKINGRKMADAEAAASEARNLQKRLAVNEELIKDIELINNILGNENTLAQLQRQTELIGLSGDALELKSLQLEVQNELETKLLEIQQKRNQLAADADKLGADRVQQEIDRLSEEERLAREFADKKLEIEKDLYEKTKALRNDTALATKTFFEQLDRSIDPAVLTAKKWESVFSNIEGAIDTLVTTGKFNFKDFALSIIADLLKIQMRAIVVQAILAAIGAIFGGAKPVLGGGGGSGINTAGFAANGATPLAGQPFIVGEQGPELFIPKTAGTIMPNGSMSNNQVSAPVTNNYNTYNINAVDAKSVAQLFAENRKSLLGAVGMAQKEMPYMMAG